MDSADKTEIQENLPKSASNKGTIDDNSVADTTANPNDNIDSSNHNVSIGYVGGSNKYGTATKTGYGDTPETEEGYGGTPEEVAQRRNEYTRQMALQYGPLIYRLYIQPTLDINDDSYELSIPDHSDYSRNDVNLNDENRSAENRQQGNVANECVRDIDRSDINNLRQKYVKIVAFILIALMMTCAAYQIFMVSYGDYCLDCKPKIGLFQTKWRNNEIWTSDVKHIVVSGIVLIITVSNAALFWFRYRW